jgi:hypothetical protein
LNSGKTHKTRSSTGQHTRYTTRCHMITRRDTRHCTRQIPYSINCCREHFPLNISSVSTQWRGANTSRTPGSFVRPGNFSRWTPYLNNARAIFNDDFADYVRERQNRHENFVRWTDRQGLDYQPDNIDYFARCYRNSQGHATRPRFSWPQRDQYVIRYNTTCDTTHSMLSSRLSICYLVCQMISKIVQ